MWGPQVIGPIQWARSVVALKRSAAVCPRGEIHSQSLLFAYGEVEQALLLLKALRLPPLLRLGRSQVGCFSISVTLLATCTFLRIGIRLCCHSSVLSIAWKNSHTCFEPCLPLTMPPCALS